MTVWCSTLLITWWCQTLSGLSGVDVNSFPPNPIYNRHTCYRTMWHGHLAVTCRVGGLKLLFGDSIQSDLNVTSIEDWVIACIVHYWPTTYLHTLHSIWAETYKVLASLFDSYMSYSTTQLGILLWNWYCAHTVCANHHTHFYLRNSVSKKVSKCLFYIRKHVKSAGTCPSTSRECSRSVIHTFKLDHTNII